MRIAISMIFVVLLLISCSHEDESCDNFSDVTHYQNNTSNGVPFGAMSFTILGTSVRSYSSDLPLTLSRYNYWKSLYVVACNNDAYSSDDVKYYHEGARYYATLLIAEYITAKNTILEFDGISSFVVRLQPVDPDSAEPDILVLSISDLTPADIGVEITLSSTTPTRIFSIENKGAIYSSLEAGSILKMKILNIRPVNEITTVEITASSILFNDTGNLESVNIGGTINAYRK